MDINLGQNIKLRRLELGISQKDLARATGYKSHSAIAKIESGENAVPISKLVKFSRALDTSIECLIVGYEKEGNAGEKGVAQPKNREFRCAALILAGGKSTRNQQNIPNQFINVLGKPIIMYSLEAYQRHPMVDDIYVVCLKGWEKAVEAYASRYSINKLKEIVPAGNTGLRSIKNGVMQIMSDGFGKNDIILVQETTRPFVNEETITKLLSACTTYGSSVICESLYDHLAFETKRDGSAEYLDRDHLISMQSPDAHRASALLEMFNRAKHQGIPLKENCCGMLLHQLGMPLHFCEDVHSNNIKIVRQEDIAVFAALLRCRDA